MKTKLRLLVTSHCNKNCPGCCNKDWDIKNLPKITIAKAAEYNEIMITGGEPLLHPEKVNELMIALVSINPSAKIFIYTANIRELASGSILDSSLFSGVHITLHEDITKHELQLLKYMQKRYPITFKTKSMRLQIFPDIKRKISIVPRLWKRITFNPWIKNCPLPIDEDFMQLEKLF
jgi:organic radical activating enzyme